MRISRNIRGVAFALIGGVSWGFSGACAQYLFAGYGVDPVWVSSVRMLCAGVVLSCFCLVTLRGPFLALWKTPQSLVRLVAFGLIGVPFVQITYLIAIQYSNAGTATVIQYTCPAMIVLYLCVVGRRLPKAREVIGVVCVILGTFLVATHGNPTTLVLTPEALFWALVSAFAYALYSLMPRWLMARYGSVPVVAAALLVGGVAFFLGARSWTVDPGLDASGYVVLFVGLVLCGTVVGFSLYFQAVRDIGAAKSSLIASVETVSATVLAVVWLGTEFVPIDIIGFAFIVATVFILANHSDESAAPASTQAQGDGCALDAASSGDRR